MKEIIEHLIKLKKSVSAMESCSGGALASAITDIPGASEVFEYSAVTYSNFFKIKMGVNKKIIDQYSVYSMETAIEMSKAIVHFTLSDYGVGITGKLNRVDNKNPYGEDNTVFISIYDKSADICYQEKISITSSDRVFSKKEIVNKVISMFQKILKISN